MKATAKGYDQSTYFDYHTILSTFLQDVPQPAEEIRETSSVASNSPPLPVTSPDFRRNSANVEEEESGENSEEEEERRSRLVAILNESLRKANRGQYRIV